MTLASYNRRIEMDTPALLSTTGRMSQKDIDLMTTPNDTPEISLKRCTKCGVEKPKTREYFYPRQDGWRSQCRDCEQIAKLTWQNQNKERMAAKSKIWHEENHDYVAQKKREYNQEHSEEIRQYKRQYNATHAAQNSERRRRRRESHLEEEKLSIQQWREKNAEYILLYSRQYRQTHQEECRARAREYSRKHPEQVKAAVARRRARKMGSTEHYTVEDVQIQYKTQKGLCWHCGKPLGDKYHIDHLIPLSRGGSNGARNVVLACIVCNLSKHDKFTWEWNGRLL